MKQIMYKVAITVVDVLVLSQVVVVFDVFCAKNFMNCNTHAKKTMTALVWKKCLSFFACVFLLNKNTSLLSSA